MESPTPLETLISMLHGHDFGVLATSGTEYPYTSLVTIYVSEDHRSLFFPTPRETRKYANLARDANVSVLLDNRSSSGSDIDELYALSIFGTAREVDGPDAPECKSLFSRRHPRLADFLSLPQTALIQVTISRIILVGKFQEIQVFDRPFD
jgi:heme iron utilization protein